MLITLSGMVGSGKSTTASLLTRRLEEHGFRPEYVRFRYLRLVGFAKPTRPRSTGTASTGAPTRGQDFTLKPLTLPRAAAYLVRILAFRLAGIGKGPACVVLDRYFYDNFVQYQLRSARERLYAGVLGRVIPVPDLALLLVARDETIAMRRPLYAATYVEDAGRRYRELPAIFPHLVAIRTDSLEESTEALDEAVRRLLKR